MSKIKRVKKGEKKENPLPLGARAIRTTCNHCNASGRLTFTKSPTECGGTRCRGCKRFDNFYSNFDIDGEKLVYFTVIARDNMVCRQVAKGDDAERFQDFFKLNSDIQYWEIANILIEAGLGYEKKDKNPSSFIEDEEQQQKREKQLARKLKKHLRD